MKAKRLSVVIDKREKTPWLFSGHTVSRAMLKTGDYTLRGYRDYLSVERKSWVDFMSCITTEWDRFYRNPLSQVSRLMQLDHACIIVEGNVFTSIHKRYPNLVHLDTPYILDKISEISLYVPVCLFANRLTAQHGCVSFLTHGKKAIDNG